MRLCIGGTGQAGAATQAGRTRGCRLGGTLQTYWSSAAWARCECTHRLTSISTFHKLLQVWSWLCEVQMQLGHHHCWSHMPLPIAKPIKLVPSHDYGSDRTKPHPHTPSAPHAMPQCHHHAPLHRAQQQRPNGAPASLWRCSTCSVPNGHRLGKERCSNSTVSWPEPSYGKKIPTALYNSTCGITSMVW